MSEVVDAIRRLSSTGADKAVYCREFSKADGRMLRLYGYEEHYEPVQAQDSGAVATGGVLRRHPLRGEWNIYAAHRQNRTFKPAASDDPLAPTKPGGPATEIPFADFELAVFDNKFSGLHPATPPPAALSGIETAKAGGACEVVVYSPESGGNLNSIGQSRRRLLIEAWIDRYAALFEQGCEYVLPFENRGDEVGVTLHHPHGQIYGFPYVPMVQQSAVAAFAQGYDLAAEIARSKEQFGIAEANGMSAFCPRFARFPYEVWIAPDRALEALSDCSGDEREGFAALLGDVTRRYDAFFGQDTPTMMALHCAPRGGTENYHFTAQFYPLVRAPGRLKYLASVEQHTGVFTVDVMPESAAAALREL